MNTGEFEMRRFIASLLFVPTIASAEFMSGNSLLDYIQSRDSINRIYAMGYIAGVADANMSVTSCPPITIELGQIRDMVEQYLIINASTRHLSADVLIGDMLNKRWPCKTEQRGRGA